MTRRRRLAALETLARTAERPRRVYLRLLMRYLEVKRAARDGGDPSQQEEARELRARLEALAEEIG